MGCGMPGASTISYARRNIHDPQLHDILARIRRCLRTMRFECEWLFFNMSLQASIFDHSLIMELLAMQRGCDKYGASIVPPC